jgi:hypothetical protein
VTELLDPFADCLSGNVDASFKQKLGYICKRQLVSQIPPDSQDDYCRRESMPFKIYHAFNPMVLGSYYSAMQDVVFLKDLKLQYIVVFTVLGMV